MNTFRDYTKPELLIEGAKLTIKKDDSEDEYNEYTFKIDGETIGNLRVSKLEGKEKFSIVGIPAKLSPSSFQVEDEDALTKLMYSLIK
jgi:hypothetical protein